MNSGRKCNLQLKRKERFRRDQFRLLGVRKSTGASAHLCRNIKEAVNQPRHLGRCVLDVLVRALCEGHVGVLVVEAVVLGQDVLLVVPLQRLPQLDIWDGVALLCVGYLLHFLVKSGKFILKIQLKISRGQIKKSREAASLNGLRID